MRKRSGFVTATFLAAALAVGLACPGPAPAQGNEEEAGRVSLGQRGILVFTNRIMDVIEGQSLARVCLARDGAPSKQLMERPGVLVEDVQAHDWTGDGVEEVAVLWRWMGQARLGAFELFAVDVTGAMSRVWPAKDEEPLPGLEAVPPEDLKDAPAGTLFAVRWGLVEVSRRPPVLEKTRYVGRSGDAFTVLEDRVGEPQDVYQALNLAMEQYRLRLFEPGLAVARETLERIQLSGPAELLGDAYLVVAKGYRGLGKDALATAFEKRAGLRFSLQPSGSGGAN